MRGVGDEPLLGGEGPLQAVQHVVEGVGQFLQFVVGAVQLDPPGEVGAGHAARGPGDPAQRREDPPGHGVAEGEGDHAEADQGQQRAAQQVVQGLLALVVDAELHRVVEGARAGEAAAGEGRAGVAVDRERAAGDLERQLVADVHAWAASR